MKHFIHVALAATYATFSMAAKPNSDSIENNLISFTRPGTARNTLFLAADENNGLVVRSDVTRSEWRSSLLLWTQKELSCDGSGSPCTYTIESVYKPGYCIQSSRVIGGDRPFADLVLAQCNDNDPMQQFKWVNGFYILQGYVEEELPVSVPNWYFGVEPDEDYYNTLAPLVAGLNDGAGYARTATTEAVVSSTGTCKAQLCPSYRTNNQK